MGSELPFRELEHTADRAFVVRGGDLAELFVHSAQALFSAGGAHGEVSLPVSRTVEVCGADLETLLVNWLNELLYLQETYGESYTRFEIQAFSDRRLRAAIYAAPGARARRVIKAVTFHGLRIERSADGWEAVFVVDV